MPTRNVLAVTDRLDTFAVQKGDPAMMEKENVTTEEKNRATHADAFPPPRA